MKKLFFFATAAVALLAGCNKNNPAEVTPPAVDNDEPVAVALNAKSPATVETKAAVDAWDDTEIFAFAIKTTKDEDGTETKSLVFEEKDLTVAADGSIALNNDNGLSYYYSEAALYDFYAYYKGNATFTAKHTDATAGIQYDVTFTGAEDVMYAQTNKEEDVNKADLSEGVTVSDLYSAWAARRGVQPTLVFKHALTRFNFNIIGADDSADDVVINNVKVQSKSTGVLTVYGTTPGLEVVAPDHENDGYLDLDESVLPYEVTSTATDDDELDACLMVAPEMEVVYFELEMFKDEDGDKTYTEGQDTDLDPYKFSVNITDVELAEGAPTDRFAAGYAYNINVKVYGPMAIEISAELTPWLPGGEAVYDPDENENRPGTGTTPSTEPNLINAAISYVNEQSSYDAFYAGVANAPTYADAQASGTLPWLVVKFDEVTGGKELKVQVKYDGELVKITPKTGNWPEGTTGGYTLTTTPANAFQTVGFEVKDELGFADPTTLDFNKFEMTVLYDGHVNVFKFE